MGHRYNCEECGIGFDLYEDMEGHDCSMELTVETELFNKIQALELQVKELEKERGVAREALEFYGEKEKWKQWDTDYGMDKNVLDDDSDEEFIMGYGYCCGKRAREALLKLKEMEGK